MDDEAIDPEAQLHLRRLEEENRTLRRQLEALSTHCAAGDDTAIAEYLRQQVICAQIVQQAPVGIAILHGPDYRFTLANPKLASHFDADEGLIGRTLLEVFGAVMAPLLPALDEVRRTGQTYQVVDLACPLSHAHARQILYLTLDFSALPDRPPELTDILMLARDTSHRVHALAERERLLRDVECHAAEMDATLASIADGLIIYAPDGTIVRTNTRADLLLGLTRQEQHESLITVWARRHPEDQDGAALSPDAFPSVRALRGEQVPGMVISIHPASGSTTWLFVSAGPIRTATGEILGVVTTYSDITPEQKLRQERERLLAAIQEKAAEMDATITSIPDGVLIYSLTGEVIRANPAAETLLCFSEKERCEASELRWERLNPRTPEGEPIPLHLVPMRRALNGEEVHDIDVIFARPHIGKRWFSISAAPIRAEGGHILGAVSTFTDVTERRATEEALRESEALFRSLAENANAVIGIVQGTHFVYVNPYMTQLSGYTPEELLVTDISEMVHPSCRELVMTRALLRQAGAMLPSRYEFIMLTKSGEPRWIDFTPTRTEYHGKPALVGVGIDITERKQAEEAVRESEALFRSLADNANAIIAIVQGTHFIYTNPYFSLLSGFSQDELLAMDISQVIAPSFHPLVLERAEKRQAGDTSLPIRYEFAILTKDSEERLVDFSAARTEYHGHSAIVGVAYDITARKLAEEALRASEIKFRSLIENMSEAVVIDEIVFDAEGRPVDWIIREVNPAYEMIYQRSREQVIGKRATEIYPVWAERLEEMRGYARQLEAGIPLQLEMEDAKTGRYLLISAFSMGDHYFAAVTTNISERKRAEEERERLLKEISHHAAELDAVITALPDPLLIYDAQGTVLRVNPATRTLIKFDPTGRNLLDLSHMVTIRYPDGHTLRVLEDLPAMRALHGEVIHGERYLITLESVGEIIALVDAAPLRLEDRIWGSVVVWRDVSAQERLLGEVAQRAAELDASLNSIVEGLIIYSATGEVLRTNPTVERLFGEWLKEQVAPEAEQWLTRHARTPEGQAIPFAATPVRRALLGEIVHGVTVVFSCAREDDLWVSVSAAPIRTADGHTLGVVATYTDITAQHELQQQHEVYVHTISHDLRAPLASIQGYAQVVKEELEGRHLNGTLLPSMNAILRNAQRMNVMIADLVDAARVEGKRAGAGTA